MLMNYFKMITGLKNKEKGKRAFILCNGPSINRLDLSFLKEEVVIGMNASTLLEKEYNFISDYYVVSDVRFLQHEDKAKFATTDLNEKTIRVFREELKEIDVSYAPNKTYYVKALKRDGFSPNLAAGYFFGCTTTMLALQLAYYLGITEVYILGCDLRYSEKEPRFYKEKKPQLEDAFTSIQLKNISDAALYFEKEERKVYHCYKDSLLNPYVNFKEFSSIFK